MRRLPLQRERHVSPLVDRVSSRTWRVSGESGRVDRHKCGDRSVTGFAFRILLASTRGLIAVISTSSARAQRVIAHGPYSRAVNPKLSGTFCHSKWH